MYPKAFIPSAEAFAKNPRISEEEDDGEDDNEKVSEESDSGGQLSEVDEDKEVFQDVLSRTINYWLRITPLTRSIRVVKTVISASPGQPSPGLSTTQFLSLSYHLASACQVLPFLCLRRRLRMNMTNRGNPSRTERDLCFPLSSHLLQSSNGTR